MTMIPTAAKTQKERRVGRTVEAPIPKATKSVTEVMVIATPALPITLLIISSSLASPSPVVSRVVRHWRMTNLKVIGQIVEQMWDVFYVLHVVYPDAQEEKG